MAASVLTKEFESGFLRRIQYSNRHSTPSRLRVTTLDKFWGSSSFHSRQAWKTVRTESRSNREAVRVPGAPTQFSAPQAIGVDSDRGAG
jgi:hypothetical protein